MLNFSKIPMSDTIGTTASSVDSTVTNLSRIRGQLDGIIRMYEDEKACVDIVRQVIAARNSLGRVARDLLSGEATRCSNQHRLSDLEAIIAEVFKY